MKREEIKSYKDACKVIGRKPRTYKDKHLNLYEQLSTIIAALNFISNGNKPWTPKFNYCYIYSWLCREDEHNKSAGLFHLYSGHGFGLFQCGCRAFSENKREKGWKLYNRKL